MSSSMPSILFEGENHFHIKVHWHYQFWLDSITYRNIIDNMVALKRKKEHSTNLKKLKTSNNANLKNIQIFNGSVLFKFKPAVVLQSIDDEDMCQIKEIFKSNAFRSRSDIRLNLSMESE